MDPAERGYEEATPGGATRAHPAADSAPSPDRFAVRLALPAARRSLDLLRQAIGAAVEALRVPPALAIDIAVAASEACSCVLLADGCPPAALYAGLALLEGHLVVDVRGACAPTRRPGLEDAGSPALGVTVMAALADRFHRWRDRHGEQVRMAFRLGPEAAGSSPTRGPGSAAAEPLGPPGNSEIGVAVQPCQLGGVVLGRIVSVLAARADFSIDRLCDAQLVSDAIAAHAATHATDGQVGMSIVELERTLELRVGPLVEGGAGALVRDTALPGLGMVLERLASDLHTEGAGPDVPAGAERLVVRLAGEG